MVALRYSIREAFEGFRRAKISSFISIFTLSFLLILIGILGIVSLNVDRMVNALHANVEIQAFIANTLDDKEISLLQKKIEQLEGVESVDFYSKEDAAREIRKEFGQELFDILEENPLPSSFNVKLLSEYKNPESIEKIAGRIEKEPGIDEVVYHTLALNALNQYARVAKIINIVFLVFVTFGSLFIVSNTIRLIITAKRDVIETMKLVGATKSFIRRPFLIEGIIQGLFGGLIAVGVVYLLIKLVQLQAPGLIYISLQTLSIIAGIGVLFGYLGSLFAIKKFL